MFARIRLAQDWRDVGMGPWGLQRLSPVKDRPLELDPRQALLVVAIGEARDMIHPTQIGSWDCDGRQVA